MLQGNNPTSKTITHYQTLYKGSSLQNLFMFWNLVHSLQGVLIYKLKFCYVIKS